MTSTNAPCFITFTSDVSAHRMPDKFTFPFYYQPHPLCVLAAQELQQHLLTQSEWKGEFGWHRVR